ncbi:MAG: hypothetical protein V1701_02375 [Planctomycetota bacterium]
MENRCKECGKRVRSGKSIVAFARTTLRLCAYCYNARFPEPKQNNLPPCRQGSKRLLTPYDRQRMARKQFEGIEVFIWPKESYRQWLEAIREG